MTEWKVGDVAYAVQEYPPDIAYEKGQKFYLCEYVVTRVTSCYVTVIQGKCSREEAYHKDKFIGLSSAKEAFDNMRQVLLKRIRRAEAELSAAHHSWMDFCSFQRED